MSEAESENSNFHHHSAADHSFKDVIVLVRVTNTIAFRNHQNEIRQSSDIPNKFEF